MKTFSSKLYQAMEWITKFAFLQLLWVLGTLAGLIVLGIYPATGAAFSVTRKWLNGKTDQKVLSMFYHYYRKDFVKLNVLGLWINFLLLLVYLDIFYLQNNQSLLSIPFFAFIFILAHYLLYIFPVYAHFEYTVGEVIKNTFFLLIVNPTASFFLGLTTILLTILYVLFPAVSAIFGISLFAFLITWNARFTFQKLKN
ncbi:YesL family protein [Thalassobacillus sp. B23F22_16]|uniref:YesL family protein n=1 Tax=Thalassobacillus sp. B23F22_16 TaxID=3459513 RepID=UPI00373EBCFA